jgi:hypothetical protein
VKDANKVIIDLLIDQLMRPMDVSNVIVIIRIQLVIVHSILVNVNAKLNILEVHAKGKLKNISYK